MAKVRKTKKSSAPPLMSSAGIMRYFEEEKTQIKISPKSVIAFGLITGVMVIVLNAFYGLWP
ncbi:preprotein translocase subunit Sec61beta [Archaeoglobales archaeon]|nr:MAG: preprotein translocase subunit Sec61beta [Archaeoglobales archaeon]